MRKPSQVKLPILTYQTRIALDAPQSVVLDAYTELYGRAERSLFADMQTDASLNDLKCSFLPRFAITARQFNALRAGLEGKIDSIKARRPELIAELQSRIKQAVKVVAKLSKKSGAAAKVHQKKRRLAILQTKLNNLQADHKADIVRLCFGSKKLFRAQFNLEANGYADHAAWKADWIDARSNQFFALGSKDEIAGNQSCQASLNVDGTLDIRLRLPDALCTKYGKYLLINGVRFAYGHQAVVSALASSERVPSTTKSGKPIVKRIGRALSYRFVRDAKGWRVFVSCQAPALAIRSSRLLGAVGIDINADHLAVSETDRFGNLVEFHRIDLHTYGKNTDQAKALIGDAAVAVVNFASKAGKPLVMEELDFAKKKAELENTDVRYARMLSSFACNKVVSSLKAAAFRTGVETIEVNPAYTSVIGAVNHAQRNGISNHLGSALAIARRGLGLSEKATVHTGLVPIANGGHVTFELPVRNRSKHVWSFWSKTRTNLKAAHVAHYRCGDQKRPPPPLTPEMRSLRATRYSAAQLRGANRQHNCSADVLGDVPW